MNSEKNVPFRADTMHLNDICVAAVSCAPAATAGDKVRPALTDTLKLRLNMDRIQTSDTVVEALPRLHGPILGGETLWRTLGYPTARAFSKAVERKTVPVPTFWIPHRRGRFALTSEVMSWLRTVAQSASE